MSGGQRTAISDSVRARIAGHARGPAGVFPSVYRSGSESSRQHSQRTSRLNTACLTANENPYWFGLLTKTHPDSTTPLRCQHGRCSIALICKTLRRNTGAYVFPTRFVEGGPRLWVEQPSLPFTGKAARVHRVAAKFRIIILESGTLPLPRLLPMHSHLI